MAKKRARCCCWESQAQEGIMRGVLFWKDNRREYIFLWHNIIAVYCRTCLREHDLETNLMIGLPRRRMSSSASQGSKNDRDVLQMRHRLASAFCSLSLGRQIIFDCGKAIVRRNAKLDLPHPTQFKKIPKLKGACGFLYLRFLGPVRCTMFPTCCCPRERAR